MNENNKIKQENENSEGGDTPLMFDSEKATSSLGIKQKNKQKASAKIAKSVAEKKSTNFAKNIKYKISPTDIKNKIDKNIVGNEATKKGLSSIIYDQYVRYNCKKNGIKSIENLVNPNNVILLAGDSGTGKTKLGEEICKSVGLPFVIFDANQLTSYGYVGADVDEMVRKLYINSGCDLERTEHGIIFIDEICKKASRKSNQSITRDVSGEDVQAALLTMLDGCDVYIRPNESDKRRLIRDGESEIKISTRNIIFILSGAFSGIDSIINSEHERKKIGFFPNNAKDEEIENKDKFKLLKPEHIEKYGFMPEFVGRINSYFSMEKMSKENIKKMILTSEFSTVFYYQKYYKDIHGINIVFSDELINKIVEESYSSQYGLRIIKKIVNEIMVEFNYILSDLNLSDSQKIEITLEYKENKCLDNLKII